MLPDIGRRAAAAFGATVLAAALTEGAQAQKAPAPSPENLERELPSPRAAPPVGTDLPEFPAPQPEGISERLLPGFRSQDIQTGGATIRVLTKGNGLPLLLIHGHPETHVT